MIENTLVSTLAISLLIQAIFFAFAATLKTDTVTDLAYGLSFVILAVLLSLRNDPSQSAQWVLSLMVVVWGVRLAGYLFYRILRMKRDPRFDGVRERFWSFFRFWLFQGIAIWVILLPVTVWFDAPRPWNGFMSAGLFVWAVGLVIETVADLQKFRQKVRANGADRWMASGLWRYSRHPNYFGELLCWWGVFLYVAGDLSGWAWLSILGPMALTGLLLYATGIPTLEKSAERKWGNNAAYQEYKRKTSLLIPWFVSEKRPAS